MRSSRSPRPAEFAATHLVHQEILAGLRSACDVLESLSGLAVRLADEGQRSSRVPLREAIAAVAIRLDQVAGLLRSGAGVAPPDAAPLPAPASASALASASASAPAAAPATSQPPAELAGHRQCVLSASGPGFSVPGIIEFLCRSGRTGTLCVATTQDHFTLELIDGQLVHALSDNRPEDERLGTILCRLGAIPPPKLDRLRTLCQAESKAEGPLLGEVLEREELVSPEALLDALREQVRCLFQRLFSDDGEWFAFYEGCPAVPALHVRLNLMRLLLECARTVDERKQAHGRGTAAPDGSRS